MILDRILTRKRNEIACTFDKYYISKIKSGISANKKQSGFSRALLAGSRPAIIGEIKKASPSAGIIIDGLDVGRIADEYDAAEVEAISVVTEKEFFLGDIVNINEVRKRIKKPILRKDFIIDMLQIYESAYFGADAILLIAEILSETQLSQFIRIADSIGLECLVESHDENSFRKAVNSGARLIGINNRDLKTMRVIPETTGRIMERIKTCLPVVSESGISCHEGYEYVKKCGVSAVLAGEVFMRSASIEKKARELRYGS